MNKAHLEDLANHLFKVFANTSRWSEVAKVVRRIEIEARINELTERLELDDISWEIWEKSLVKRLEELQLELAHDEIGHLCKIINPEGKVWLERAKYHLQHSDSSAAIKCINEAIEFIYGKVE